MSTAFNSLEFTAAARAAPPAVALVLGSGLGQVARRVGNTCSVPFVQIPGLPAAAIAGHRGCLTLGNWAGRRLLLFEGRAHFYEGHPWRDVTAGVQAARALGVRTVLLTCAAGGIRADLAPGSLMAIREHVDWTGPNCWRLGRPTTSPYTPRLLGLLEEAARSAKVDLTTGNYAAVTGPCYETPAEIRALRQWGADAVGMSTAREAQAACDGGMECAAIACITNRAAGLADGPLHHEEVLSTAAAQSERFADLLEQFLRRL